jgi:hypothetical protein
MNILKEKFSELRTWFLRKRVIWNLKKSNRYAIEAEKVMELFATNRILSGDNADARNQSRNVLVQHQNVIRVKSDFQDFLETL